MLNNYILYYVYVCFIIYTVGSAMSQNEYMHLKYRPKCDNGASLVENFFNIIFSEFQNIPPACVCVQMCLEQPTYCYPNGCFKISVNKKKIENPVSKISGNAQSAMFLVDDDKDFFEILKDTKARDAPVKTARPLNEFILRPNPFTELVLKQKRLPKLKMRYNLREQVKNTKPNKLKRDNVNFSKTRWPLNKQVFHSKQPRNDINHYKRNDDKKQTNFYASMIQEQEANYTPKYLTKYLTKRENGNVNMEAIYLYKTDSSNFSLEALIDNMIEGSLDENKNNVKLDLNIDMNNSSDLSTESTRKVLRESDFNMTSDNKLVLNVISLKFNNDTSYNNKHAEELLSDSGTKTNIIENIEEMTKKIDGQNKLSIEIVEKITGSTLQSFTSGVPQITIEMQGETPKNTDINKSSIPEVKNIIVNRSSLKKRETLNITDIDVPFQNNIIKRKSKQRVTRTLNKRKFN